MSEVDNMRRLMTVLALEAKMKVADYVGDIGSDKLSADLMQILAGCWAGEQAVKAADGDLTKEELAERSSALFGLLAEKAGSIRNKLKMGGPLCP